MPSFRKLSDEQLLAQCRFDAFRGPGPGGQKRNKTSSAVRLTHPPTGISVIAGESRSQARNRAVALRRLRHQLALRIREPVNSRRFPNPDLSQISRRSAGYAAAMGAVLDVLESAGWSVSDGADILGVTTARLVRFLRADEKLWANVNQRRKKIGLRGLN
jgi:RF-1 domain